MTSPTGRFRSFACGGRSGWRRPSPGHHRRTAPGFSLLELLVSMAMLMVLVGILLPALGNSIRRARLLQCSNNLRMIKTAIEQYVNETDGAMPIAEYYPYHTRRAPALRDTLNSYGGGDVRVWVCPADPRDRDQLIRTGSYIYPAGYQIVEEDGEIQRVMYDSLPQTYPVAGGALPFHRPNFRIKRPDEKSTENDLSGKGGQEPTFDETRFAPGKNRIYRDNRITVGHF